MSFKNDRINDEATLPGINTNGDDAIKKLRHEAVALKAAAAEDTLAAAFLLMLI